MDIVFVGSWDATACWRALFLRMSLIKHFFPDQTEKAHKEMLAKLLPAASASKSKYLPKCMMDIVKHLESEEDANMFGGLKDQIEDTARVKLVVGRVGFSKGRAQYVTPESIKSLRPSFPKVVLCWQFSKDCFEAYYPKPAVDTAEASSNKRRRRVQTHWSTSSKYGGERTQLQALKHCVFFLWGHHKKAGHVARIDV